MLVHYCARAGTIASIGHGFFYSRFVGAGTVAPGVSGCSIVLGALVWITGTWFLVVVAWRHSLLVMVMGVGILGLMLVWVV